jgi:hypothetical protein
MKVLKARLPSLLLLSSISTLAYTQVFVIPGIGYLPSTVRAACRAALATNITQCSSKLFLSVENILATDLTEVCTSNCSAALNSMYNLAATRCGTDDVVVPLNGTDTLIVNPLRMAEELVYRFNMSCLQDKWILWNSYALY